MCAAIRIHPLKIYLRLSAQYGIYDEYEYVYLRKRIQETTPKKYDTVIG